MPEIDLERVHRDVVLRLIGAHQICYTIVGPREEIGLQVPELLRSRCIRNIAELPKSGLQLLSPQWYQRYHLERNLGQAVRFGVIFEDSFAAWSGQVFGEPALLHVLCWFTRDATAIGLLAKAAVPFVVAPGIPGAEEDLLKAGIPKDCIAKYSPAILARIESEVVRKITAGSPGRLAERTALNRKIADEWRNTVTPGTQRPFYPLDVNRSQLRQLLGEFRGDFWAIEKEKDLNQRPAAQAALFDAVANTIAAIATSDEADPRYAWRLPSAVVAFPSVSPFLKRLLQDRLREVKGKFRLLAKEVVSLLQAEQDTATYELKYTPRDGGMTAAALPFVAQEVGSYTRFFDDVGYLHGSFHTSPYLRAAMKGKSLAQHHSFFSPATFRVGKGQRAVLRKIRALSTALARSFDSRMHNALVRYPGAVVALSDLPVEWLAKEGVPLCFSHDVCRIPETGPTNMLSHFTRNRHSLFEIGRDIVAKTLVVCGAPAGDAIEQSFRFHADRWLGNKADWRWEHCESLDRLFALVNEFRPQLLIFDTHGRFIDNNSGSELQIGSEFLNGVDVIKRLPQVPLVMLSTCWGAPLYGCPNTIAHAFFEAGSFAVTSSMLPLSVFKGANLYNRVLGNLAYACEHAVHPNWASFVSHNVRTSYLDDLKERIFFRVPNGLVDQDSYVKVRTQWQAESMFPGTRNKAFNDAPGIVAGCFGAGAGPTVRRMLADEDYIPEYMYYSTMGRADLIQFSVWNERRHRKGDDSMSFGELKASLGDPP